MAEMEYEEIDLRPVSDAQPPAPPPQRPRRGTWIAALLILVVAVTGYLVYRNRASSSTPVAAETPDTPPAAPTPLGAEADAIALPPLDETDEIVRQLVSKLTSHPSVVAWLATDDLIRTFTVVMSNIASRERASGHVPVLKPRAQFAVDERGEDIYMSPRSHARYTQLATAASSVAPADAARLYTMLKPRIEDAYKELGFPDAPFDQTLERAIVLLLNTPIPTGPVRLQPAGANSYAFADPKLEVLTPSQKLLIRFGPDNQRAVQSSLRAMALALGIAEDRLP